MSNSWQQITKPQHKISYQELKCHNISSYRNDSNITKTSLFKYTENFPLKYEIFR